MREDMDKVIVERPRLGGGRGRSGRPPRDLEDQPRFLGMRRQAKLTGDFKTLNENLAPLRRYLGRQVGRPWNKVYGEISARIDRSNAVQAHVLTHLDQMIHRTVWKVAATPAAPCGLMFHRVSFFHGGQQAVDEGDLYVDPDDGLIKRARRRLKGPR
jgi:hypothetical protein